MNDLDTPDETYSDEAILAGIGRFLDELDPPPEDLVRRVQCVLVLEDLAIDVSWWAPDRHVG
jgi:hypothetical protein